MIWYIVTFKCPATVKNKETWQCQYTILISWYVVLTISVDLFRQTTFWCCTTLEKDALFYTLTYCQFLTFWNRNELLAKWEAFFIKSLLQYLHPYFQSFLFLILVLANAMQDLCNLPLFICSQAPQKHIHFVNFLFLFLQFISFTREQAQSWDTLKVLVLLHLQLYLILHLYLVIHLLVMFLSLSVSNIYFFFLGVCSDFTDMAIHFCR
jgi:hypothetical protein